jgi:LysR family nitrogen assimilation transcriptional regulator
MQYRHLRYFVKVVECGSFSRAASTIHVAQPALSQQIAQLEELLGVSLLVRNPRGVRPTAAGDVLYREASSILRQIDEIPGIVRSQGGVAQGAVRLGMSSTVMPAAPASFMLECKAVFPNIALIMAVSDSPTLKARVRAHELDLGLILEDELAPTFVRKPLFLQQLFVVSPPPSSGAASVSMQELAAMPLILPPQPNMTRTALDRSFAALGLTPNVVMEADIVQNIITNVRAGVGSSVLPKGNLTDLSAADLAQPMPIDPPLNLTCSLISSDNFPLTDAGEAVRDLFTRFVEHYLRDTAAPGVKWIA